MRSNFRLWTCQITLLILLGAIAAGCSDVSEPTVESVMGTDQGQAQSGQEQSGQEQSAQEQLAQEQSEETAAAEITFTGPGQLLDISAIAQIKDQTFQLEVAQTPQQQALGLMFRSELPKNRGMLFPFPNPRRASFWMKDVPVPLDMVFLYAGEVVDIITAPPCTAEPCDTYGPGNQIVDQVLELRGGRAAEIGLEVGDAVVIQPLDSAL